MTNSIRELTALQMNGHPPLKDFIEINHKRDYGTVEHYGGSRSLSFTIVSKRWSEEHIQKQLKNLLKEYPLPDEIRLSYGAELREEQRFRKTALALLLLALILLFLLLTAIFESLKLPLIMLTQLMFTILFTIGTLGLLGIPLSGPVLFALILSGGLSVNNGLLVFASFRKGKFPEQTEALQSLEKYGISLLSAALTTAAGLIPLLFEDRRSGGLLPDLSLTVGLGIFFSLMVLFLTLPLSFQNNK